MLNSNCRAEVFQFCKLLQIVNFDGFVSFNSLIFLTAVVVFNQLDYFEPFYQRFWLAHCSVFYESIEHADYTAVHFENNICFGELNGFFIIKQIETSSVSLHFLSTLVASKVL